MYMDSPILYRGLFDHFQSQHEEVMNTESGHEGKLSHELIAAAGM